MMPPRVPYEVIESMLEALVKHQVHDTDIPLRTAMSNLADLEAMFRRLSAEAGTARIRIRNELRKAGEDPDGG